MQTAGFRRTLSFVGVPARDAETTGLLIQDVSMGERRDRSQREFVANAAHELLTPLTGIAGAVHVLETGAKDDPEIRDRFLEHISRECDRPARIARALLVLARATSGEELPRSELVELKPLLEDAIEGAVGADEVELQCPAEVTVFVDRDLVEQAFTNLVANTKRYSDDGVLIPTDESDERMVAIDILDSGPGISREHEQRIRRRFALTGPRRIGLRSRATWCCSISCCPGCRDWDMPSAAAASAIPILIVTARTAEVDHVVGLDAARTKRVGRSAGSSSTSRAGRRRSTGGRSNSPLRSFACSR